MLKEKRDVIKHSSAIQIENSISLLQRKTWNVLFANAYDELPTQEEHTVDVHELMEVLEFKSKNDRYLKESLKGLMQIIVEWNLLGKDKEAQWGATAMLASAEIKDGVCTYGYSAPLRRRLHNPTMYAKISLELQKKFNSKYALALFELFQDYFTESRQFGETPFINIPAFRKLMGVGDKYPTFKQLNERIIKKSIKEIQAVTNYVIDVEYKQVGRKVVAVKFKIAFIPKINVEEQQDELFVDTEGLPELVAELVKAGIHRNKAMRIWSQGLRGVKPEVRPRGIEFSEYVREKLDLLELERAKGNVADGGAWLVAAIQSNYTHSTYQKRQQTKRNQQKRERESELKKGKEKIQKEYEEKCETVFEAIIKENPSVIEQAMKKIVAEKPMVFEGFYDSNKTALENYNAHPFLQAGVRHELREKFPEKFQPIDNEYNPLFAEIDKEIATLSARAREKRRSS